MLFRFPVKIAKTKISKHFTELIPDFFNPRDTFIDEDKKPVIPLGSKVYDFVWSYEDENMQVRMNSFEEHATLGWNLKLRRWQALLVVTEVICDTERLETNSGIYVLCFSFCLTCHCQIIC